MISLLKFIYKIKSMCMVLMSYFLKLRNEQILNLENLEKDITFIQNSAMTLENNKQTMNIFNRRILNDKNDLQNITQSIFENWQKIVFSVYNIRDFERYLSNIILRFGFPRNNYAIMNSFLDKLCHEILERTRLSINLPFIALCGGGSYRTLNH